MADKDPLAGLPFPDEAQRMFSDPAFLEGAAAIAAKYRQPEKAMKWLEQAKLAAKEGAFEAVGHLMAGNPQEAINVWNRTGQLRDVVNVNQNKDGTYSINRKDGSTFTLDPVKEYKRFLSPREFMAYEQNEREGKERSEDRRLLREDRRAQMDETQAFRQQQLDATVADREARLDLGRAQLLARMGGGSGGSRGTGSGDGGDAGGNAPRLKPNELQKIYQESRQEVIEQAKENPDAKVSVNDAAMTLFHIKTARLQRNAKTGQWGIEIASPGGQYDITTEYDSPQEAAFALRQLQDGGMRPSQSPLLRDEDREPGGSTRPPPPRSEYPGAAPAPAGPQARRYLPSVDEARAKVAESKAATTARDKAKKSPEYLALVELRKKAMWTDDTKTIDAISAQMRALLDAAK